MNIQDAIEACLFTADIEEKLNAMDHLSQAFKVGDPIEEFKGEPRPIKDVLFLQDLNGLCHDFSSDAQ